MKVVSWQELGEGRPSSAPLAAAVGVFDGLHIGHRELVGRVLGRVGFVSAVVTFIENPKRILSPSTFHGGLSTLDQRLSLIAAMGVDLCVLIDFSGDFSKLPGRRFLSSLSESGGLRFLAVGADFRCGHRLDTDATAIREFCEARAIGVELLDAVSWAGHPVSSSRIRRAVIEGRLDDASAMLGRSYEIDLRGARPLRSGGSIPTGGQASPPPGRYEASLAFERVEGGEAAGPIEAELGRDGAWSIRGGGPPAPGSREPVGLRLIKLVSRG
jgi:riboflavin kinase/FMN adenylyltransferase